MSTFLRILGWNAQGLRCPDHEIKFYDDREQLYSTTLIQMPNGTGKTTTLSLLRAALSGSGKSWSPDYIRELRKKIKNSSDQGIFEIRLSLNNKRLTIRMEFDFEAGYIEYKTTFGSGQEIGFNPPFELKRFMNKEFVNFYIFDGELAENLLDRNLTQAGKAIESLFQTHLLKIMSQAVSEYWEDKTSIVTAKDEKGFTRRKNQLDRWRDRLRLVKKEKGNLEQNLAKIRLQLESQQKLYNQEIEKETKRAELIRDAGENVRKCEENVDNLARSILDSMRDPQSLSGDFGIYLYELKIGLDRVKLPESAAREFFEEIAEEAECICGRPIDEIIKKTIKERSHKYLASEDVSLLNAIKSTIAEAVGDSPRKASEELQKDLERLSILANQLQRARIDLFDLQTEAENADPNVKKAKEQQTLLNNQLISLQNDLQKFLTKDDKVSLDRIDKIDPEKIYSVETIVEISKQLEIRLAEVSDTLKLRQKRDILKKILQIAHDHSQKSISDEIRNEANDRIEKLMPFNNIRIEKIDNCLSLIDQSGGSVGETLSVGYAFLSTLFNRADQHQLPFVVDSPANPIDLDVRPKIGNLVPKLSEQFIAFVISSERERFIPSLIKASNGNIQFITLFRKGATHLETRAMANPNCYPTYDGFQVYGESFFSDFQLDNEEN